jgi:5'-AMP-activated protein kinase catalytic alpha subunit
MQNVQGLTGQ